MLPFAEELRERSGQNVSLCYQCKKCTAGCPAASWFEWPNHSIIRMIQRGLKDELLSSRAIWLCMTCETCGTRCPNGIHLSPLMDTLRAMAIDQGYPVPERAVTAFHRAFLESVRCYGRAHEATMLSLYKLSTLDLLSDVGVGARLFLRGKLPLWPGLVKGRRAVEKLFRGSRLRRQKSILLPLRVLLGFLLRAKRKERT